MKTRLFAIFLFTSIASAAFFDTSQVRVNADSEITDFLRIQEASELTQTSQGEKLSELSGVDAGKVFAANKENFLDNGVLSINQEIPAGVTYTIPDNAIKVSKGTQSVVGPPSLSPQQIDSILRAVGSPATGNGRCFYDASRKYNIDVAFMLAFFGKESTWGKAPGYAQHHSIGNIVKQGSGSSQFCVSSKRSGRFCGYNNWCDAAEHWFYYIKNSSHYLSKGRTTPEQIIPVYAPASENNVGAYINFVNKCVKNWRAGGVKC